MAAFQALQPDQDLIQLLSGGTAVGVDVDRRHVLIRRAPPMREVIVVGGAPYDGEPRLSAAMPRSRYTRATFPMSRPPCGPWRFFGRTVMPIDEKRKPL